MTPSRSHKFIPSRRKNRRSPRRGALDDPAAEVVRAARSYSFRSLTLGHGSEVLSQHFAVASLQRLLGVYGISDVNPSRVHLTVPRNARLRRRKPKWIVIHRGDLPTSDVTMHEGLPVTTVAKSVLDVMEATGRLGVARQAIKDARKEGYISTAELNRLTWQLNQHAHGSGAAKGHATA
jgi:hypothetical protein